MSQLDAGTIEKMPQENDENCIIRRMALLNFFRQTQRQALQPKNGEIAANLLPNMMKIIDLNFDCLERILRLLSFDDLVQIGRTCTVLNEAACTIFTPMFRNHEVLIDCDEFPFCKIGSRNQMKYHRFIAGIDIEAVLKVFGAVITNMTIVNMRTILEYHSFGKFHTKRTDEKIAYLISKYCGGNLLELKFKNCGIQAGTNVQPFPNVSAVSFDHCVLGEAFDTIANLFPNMRKLEIIDCDVIHGRGSIEQHFPQIDSFNLLVSFGSNSRSNFNSDDVKAIINMNPSMKNLSLCFCNESAYDGKMLKYASMKLQHLKCLTL